MTEENTLGTRMQAARERLAELQARRNDLVVVKSNRQVDLYALDVVHRSDVRALEEARARDDEELRKLGEDLGLAPAAAEPTPAPAQPAEPPAAAEPTPAPAQPVVEPPSTIHGRHVVQPAEPAEVAHPVTQLLRTEDRPARDAQHWTYIQWVGASIGVIIALLIATLTLVPLFGNVPGAGRVLLMILWFAAWVSFGFFSGGFLGSVIARRQRRHS